MLSYEAALERLLLGLPFPSNPEELPLKAAGGRYLVHAPIAQVDLPPFDNSAMDGWAIRAADVSSVPIRLNVVGRIAAGEVHSTALHRGQAVRVFTGSPLPTGADAVVMQEDTSWESAQPSTVEIHDRVKPWENVRLQGEDLRRSTPLLAPGTRLGAAQLACLGAAGVASVLVHASLSVTVLPNGSELTPLGRPLPTGGIYESNALALAELVSRTGASVRTRTPPPDDADALRAELTTAFGESDVVLTAGGASVGDHDLVKSVFESMGGRLNFWRVALKPGKPFFFGELQVGSKRKHLFGVPGNPVSAFVTTVVLVLPGLRQMLGAKDLHPPFRLGRLAEAVSNLDDRRQFLRVHTAPDGSVKVTGPQGSHFVSSLGTANGLVDIPPQTHWAAGTEVRVIDWD